MAEVLMWVILIVAVVQGILLLLLVLRPARIFGGVADTVQAELRSGREESAGAAREARDELVRNLTAQSAILADNLKGVGEIQRTQLEALHQQFKDLTASTNTSLAQLRGVVDERIRELQSGNEKKLDQMRQTVDEKLQSTLQKRLGESFEMVGKQLEAVQRGLGEMQHLANGVGDLKRVLTNVKTRGTWGEVQLGAILDQVLSPGQYGTNVQVKRDSSEVVEFAVKLPGPRDDPDSVVWLPLDAKFPQEDYIRIQQAAELGDADAVQKAGEALARALRLAAQDISSKYINPPHTTDFAVMFLATEGLFAEILRQPSLFEELQQRYRVVVAGPTTLAAMLSSLRMGFQTLAIEQRAAEVWKVLSAVKTEFGKFGETLDKLKKQLATASRTLDETGTRTRAMQRRLRGVEQLPEDQASRVLKLPAQMEEPVEPPAEEPVAD